MKRKLLSLTLSLTLLAGSLAGCGAAARPDNTSGTSAAPVTGTSENSAAEGLSAGSADAALRGSAASPAASAPIVVTDQIGREVRLEKPAERIVSCYYLVTASLLTLGEKDKLVGIENKADTRELYKLAAPSFLELPGVGSGKEINVEEIAKLQPDVVYLPKKQKDAADQLAALGIPTLVVNPETYDAFNDMITLLGATTGEATRAANLVTYYDHAVSDLKQLTDQATERPTVYVCGQDSYLTAAAGGMYQSTMVELAGGTPVTKDLPDSQWKDVSAEQLAAWNPDYIFNVSYATYSTDDIREGAGLADISAVKNNRLYTIPSKIEAWDYPQPSSILGLYWMAHVLHPDLVSEADYLQRATSFYKTYYGLTVGEDQF